MKTLQTYLFVALFLFGLILMTGCNKIEAPTAADAGQQALLKSSDDNDDDGRIDFVFASVSRNIAQGAMDIMPMSGSGFVVDGHVVANGTYAHIAAGSPPQPFADLGFGTWKAKRLVSLDLIGTYGAFASGAVVMEVTLTSADGDRVSGELTMNCNIPPGGLITGRDEGFFLSVGGEDFEPLSLPVEGGGMIQVGGTVFTTGEQRDDDDDDVPDISAAPTRVDFGKVNVGSSKDKTFVLKNDGTADLKINKAQVAGSNAEQYEVLDLDVPAVLAPGESREVTVRFSPTSSGIKKGQVKLFSNDPDENHFPVSFKGTGIDDL